jgi:hypothetical protein
MFQPTSEKFGLLKEHNFEIMKIKSLLECDAVLLGV